MGDWETRASALVESTLGYHPDSTGVLTGRHESGDWTLLGGQFDWGGRLLKSNEIPCQVSSDPHEWRNDLGTVSTANPAKL